MKKEAGKTKKRYNLTCTWFNGRKEVPVYSKSANLTEQEAFNATWREAYTVIFDPFQGDGIIKIERGRITTYYSYKDEEGRNQTVRAYTVTYKEESRD